MARLGGSHQRKVAWISTFASDLDWQLHNGCCFRNHPVSKQFLNAGLCPKLYHSDVQRVGGHDVGSANVGDKGSCFCFVLGEIVKDAFYKTALIAGRRKATTQCKRCRSCITQRLVSLQLWSLRCLFPLARVSKMHTKLAYFDIVYHRFDNFALVGKH